jgi:type VI protein secretion system component VasK
VSEKTILFFSFFGLIVGACAIFISWRLRRLAALKAEAEQRAVAAFEEMNRLTKQLRERPKTGQMEALLPPGERLQHMYPGVRRPQGDPQAR